MEGQKGEDPYHQGEAEVPEKPPSKVKVEVRDSEVDRDRPKPRRERSCKPKGPPSRSRILAKGKAGLRRTPNRRKASGHRKTRKKWSWKGGTIPDPLERGKDHDPRETKRGNSAVAHPPTPHKLPPLQNPLAKKGHKGCLRTTEVVQEQERRGRRKGRCREGSRRRSGRTRRQNEEDVNPIRMYPSGDREVQRDQQNQKPESNKAMEGPNHHGNWKGLNP